MAETMQALVLAEIGKVEVVDKPIPSPGPNEAVVRATAAMVCTSDVHTVGGALPVPPGRTLGHESVGVVHALGSAVEGFSVGDRVAVCAVTPCWQCPTCQAGSPSHCGGNLLGGYQFTGQRDGTMAEYFVVNDARANLTPIPEGVSDEQAVYVADMLTTGFMGVENAELRFGETVVIIGQGPVGLSATMGARLAGAGRIIVVESVPARQELARRFGADDVVDYTQGDTVEQVRDLTGGGVDAVIEALGTVTTFDQGIKMLNPRGRLSNVGYHESKDPLPIDIDAFGLGHADISVRGGLCPGGNERLGRLLKLIGSGRIDPTPMTTHRMTFAEVGRAFELMRTKEDGMIKPLITFAS
jgi:threonine dehydrogenase-like Zn-dependent dehydrogenase